MTIVMRIRVHPYKSTHFENRKAFSHYRADCDTEWPADHPRLVTLGPDFQKILGQT